MATTPQVSYNNNLSLGLLAAPQGVFDPAVATALQGHMTVTGGLQQVVSDALTFKCKAAVDIFPGAFVKVSAGTTEGLLNFPSSSTDYVDGFVLDLTSAGDYAVVYRRGINPYISGLSPGMRYYPIAGGGVTLTASGRYVLGFALDTTTLVVDITKD